MSKYESFWCRGFQWMSLWRSDKFLLTLSVVIAHIALFIQSLIIAHFDLRLWSFGHCLLWCGYLRIRMNNFQRDKYLNYTNYKTSFFSAKTIQNYGFYIWTGISNILMNHQKIVLCYSWFGPSRRISIAGFNEIIQNIVIFLERRLFGIRR